MLEIEFKTDKEILARAMISKNAMPMDFAKYLFQKYRTSYLLLQNNLMEKEIDGNLLLELTQQKFFEEYINEAKENLLRMQENWQTNKDKINMFLDKIFKKNFILKTTAFIVPPNLNRGINIGNNQFVYGHINGLNDENYDLVYLVHEALHSYFKNDIISHSIIEKIADIELAKFLNNNELSYECHNFTKTMHIKILPFWNLYLNKPDDLIKEENKQQNIIYDIDSFKCYENEIKEMDIDTFVQFLKRFNLYNNLDLTCQYVLKMNN